MFEPQHYDAWIVWVIGGFVCGEFLTEATRQAQGKLGWSGSNSVWFVLLMYVVALLLWPAIMLLIAWCHPKGGM